MLVGLWFLRQPDGLTFLWFLPNLLGAVIPMAYVVVGYLIIFVPFRRYLGSPGRWPLARFVLLLLWGAPRQLAVIMCGSAYEAAYHQTCLGLDALNAVRFVLARRKRDQTDDWRIWFVMLLHPMYLRIR